jgi:hypothetical protein
VQFEYHFSESVDLVHEIRSSDRFSPNLIEMLAQSCIHVTSQCRHRYLISGSD